MPMWCSRPRWRRVSLPSASIRSGADPVVAVAGPVLDEPVGQRREVQRVRRRASVVVRAGIKGRRPGRRWAGVSAGGGLAPGRPGEARPARTGPHAWRVGPEWLVSQRDRVCGWAVILGFDCPARGRRVKISCGVAARSASLNLDSASAHEGLAPARTTSQTSRASLSALGRASNHSDGGHKTHAAAWPDRRPGSMSCSMNSQTPASASSSAVRQHAVDGRYCAFRGRSATPPQLPRAATSRAGSFGGWSDDHQLPSWPPGR